MILELVRWRLRRMTAHPAPEVWSAAALLGLVLAIAAVSPLSGYEPGFDVSIAEAGQGPSLLHLLGTDHLGRDTFWRLLLASRSFAGPGLGACVVALSLGVPGGAVAGWYGGWSAAAIRYVGGVVASVPSFVLVLLVLTIYGDGPLVLAAAAGLAYAPALAEDIYARIHGLSADEYLLAAEAHGVPRWRVLWLHLVLGACSGLIVRHLLWVFGYVVVLETTLSYVGGFGVQEPTPSWGNMLVFEWGQGGSHVPVLAPALALWATVAATASLAAHVGGARD